MFGAVTQKPWDQQEVSVNDLQGSYNSVLQRKRSLMGQFDSPSWSSAQRVSLLSETQKTQDCPRPVLILQPFTWEALD